MSPDPTPIAVCSRSFSRSEVLRERLSARFSNVKFNELGEALAGERLVEFLTGSQRAIVGLELIDEALLSHLPELRVVSKYGVGIDRIDLAALDQRGIKLGWTGGVNRRAVAELVVGFTIDLLRGVHWSNQQIRSGQWRQNAGRQLGSATVGVIGCGHVGKEVVRLLQPFGARILAHDVLDFPEFYAAHSVTPMSLESLLGSSDVVTLHVPYDESTRGLLSRERLNLMPADACLINTARGGLVDEAALYDLLKTGGLRGAAFDVFEIEPPLGSPLVDLPNFLCTAHIAGSSHRAILAMGQAAIDGLECTS